MEKSNYDKNTLADLEKNGLALYSTLSSINDWVEKNLKFEEKEVLSQMVKSAKCDVRKINNSIASKPVFALFGVSQVGKSYLVKNLLSVDGAPLMISASNKNYDFLKEINPQGAGAESTGLVTRFTIDKDSNNDKFPIKAKLLSIKDIVIILCDSYFSDLTKMNNYPTLVEFDNLANELELKYKNSDDCQSVLTDDDIGDMKSYFINNFNKFSYYVDQIERSNYWDVVYRLISKVPVNDLKDVFGILWNHNPFIISIFKSLVNELNSLEFNKIIYLPIDAVLREKGNILDVRKLKKILQKDECVEIINSENKNFKIELAKLSALCAELSLPVDEAIAKEKPFLENTDLLDFPGARGRLLLYQDNINEDCISDMFLRGKISYLFNKYSSDYEINNLLCCLNDKLHDVNEMPNLINDWISINIGNNASERTKRLNDLSFSPLFIVFTFFNNQLEYNSTNDDKSMDYKWENRFDRFFKGETITSKFDWDVNWTNNEKTFRNFYLLRDFNFSKDTFEGFSENNSESKIRSERINHIKKLQNSFVEFPFVKKHFKDPSKAWNEAAIPNKDGSDLILENLRPASNNRVKVTNYVKILENYRLNFLSKLNRYLHVDDIKAKRDLAFQNGNEIQFGLTNLFSNQATHFSSFIKKICVTETELFIYIHDNLLSSSTVDGVDKYTVFRSQFPELSIEFDLEKNLELIRKKLRLNSIEEVKAFLLSNEINLEKALENNIKTSASNLVDGIISIWSSKMELSKFNLFIENGLKKSIFDSFVTNLNGTFSSLNIREELINIFEKKTRRVQFAREAEEYLAAVSASYINEFVCNFGFIFMSDDRLNELEEISNEFDLDLKNLLSKNSEEISDQELVDVFKDNYDIPLVENFNIFILKMRLALLSNCGFTNYDLKANEKLKVILDNLHQTKFSLNNSLVNDDSRTLNR